MTDWILSTEMTEQEKMIGVNRRKFLKAATAGVSASLTLASPTYAKGDDKQYSQMTKADLNSPITQEEIEAAQGRIIREYFEDTQSDRGLARAVPEFPNDIEIVAFNYTIDDTGVPRQYIGAVPTDKGTSHQDIEERHKEAEAHANKFSGSGSFTTQSSGYSVDPAWNEVDHNRVTVGQCKQGKYTKTCKAYEYEEDNENVFACTSIVQMIPGKNIANCSSQWQNERLHIAHNWGLNSIGGSTQIGHSPSGGHTGSLTGVSAGVSYIGASIGWSFSQPSVTRHDNSNTGHADWLFDWNDDTYETFVFRVGSKCQFDSEEQKGDKILEIDTDGKFMSQTICDGYGCFQLSHKKFSHNTHLYWANQGGVT